MSSGTLIMGVLNATPDSFSDGGDYAEVGSLVQRAMQMVTDGADIIDIGGQSTRPGATLLTPEQEAARIVPVIK